MVRRLNQHHRLDEWSRRPRSSTKPGIVIDHQCTGLTTGETCRRVSAIEVFDGSVNTLQFELDSNDGALDPLAIARFPIPASAGNAVPVRRGHCADAINAATRN